MSASTDEADPHFSRRLNRHTYSPVFSLLLLVACVVALVAYLLNTIHWTDHANHVIEKALTAEKLMLDLQSATRGYYLTGDLRMLEPYRAGKSELPGALREMRELVEDNPAQARLADDISAHSHDWLTWATDTVAATKQSAVPQLSTTSATEGQDRFDSVRNDLTTFLGNEYTLRDARSRRAARTAWWAIWIGAAVTAIVATAQCIGMRRQIRAITETYRSMIRLAKDRRHRIQELLRDLDGELKAVGDIQRSLLPIELPSVPGLDIAASYQTSQRAGGDYYDFFELPPGLPGGPARYGILIADVSGHGTPAAVLMAVTHSIAHGFDQPEHPPSELLGFVNRRLCDGYTTGHNAFVTAFYAIYDPATRSLAYSSAGHNPPRLRIAGQTFRPLDDAQGLPLGVMREETYATCTRKLGDGDTLVLYTDGITEARGTDGTFLNVEGLDNAVSGANPEQPDEMLRFAMDAVNRLAGEAVTDDRTLLIVRACAPSEHCGDDAPRQTVVVEQTSVDPAAAARA